VEDAIRDVLAEDRADLAIVQTDVLETVDA
jgi:hypothetical protein